MKPGDKVGTLDTHPDTHSHLSQSNRTKTPLPVSQAPTRPSYCHPWADGVTHWLSHHTGGIVPLTPGYGRFAAMPYVSSTHREVSATLPTPQGEHVRGWDIECGQPFSALIRLCSSYS